MSTLLPIDSSKVFYSTTIDNTYEKKTSFVERGINKITKIWKKFCGLIPNLFTRQVMMDFFISSKVSRLPSPSIGSVTDAVGVMDSLLVLVRSVNDSVAEFIKESKFIQRLFVVTKLFSGVYFPLSAYNTLKTSKKIALGGTNEALTDRSLRLVSWVATAGESLSNPLIGLMELGWASKEAFFWASPLYGVSVVFSLLSSAVYARNIWRIRQVQKACSLPSPEEKERGIDVARLTKKLSLYKDIEINGTQARRFRKVLEIKKEESNRLLSDIGKVYEEVKADPFNISSVKKGNRMVALLDKQYRNKNQFNALVIVANICMAVGIALLLVCPLGPFGNTLIALGVFLGLTMLVVSKIQTHNFEKSWKVLTNTGTL